MSVIVTVRDQVSAHLLKSVYSDSCPVDLNLVCVHGSVGYEDLGVLNALGLRTQNTRTHITRRTQTDIKAFNLCLSGHPRPALCSHVSKHAHTHTHAQKQRHTRTCPTPIFLSRMYPSSRYDSLSVPPVFLMMWMASRLPLPACHDIQGIRGHTGIFSCLTHGEASYACWHRGQSTWSQSECWCQRSHNSSADVHRSVHAQLRPTRKTMAH